MAAKRKKQTGEVMAIRLPLELDREIKSEAQRLRVRPCDLARVAMAVGWTITSKTNAMVRSIDDNVWAVWDDQDGEILSIVYKQIVYFP